jgi:small subunit ribosomal protein S6e
VEEIPVLIVSDPENGKSKRVELEESRMAPLMGRRIGEVLDGAVANMAGHKLRLTGGTDKDGIPMRPDVHGSAKANIILSGGVGYKPKNKGERKRVIVRGNTVSTDTTFLNLVIIERPKRKKSEISKVEKTSKEEKKEEEAEEE